MRRTLTAALAVTAAALALAAPAMPKSISQIPAACTDGTSAHGIFLRQGADFSFGFGASGAGGVGTWHVTIGDNGVAMYDRDIAGTTAWNLVFSRTLSKGAHLITYRGENLTTGAVCTAAVSTKV